ncbi:MAG: hypothetical protein AAB406_02390 [Pseudomonadota bacterium]
MFAILTAAAGVTGFSTIWGAGAAAGLAGGGGGVVLQAVAATAAISSTGIFFSIANLIAYLLCVGNGQPDTSMDFPRSRPSHLLLYFCNGQRGFVNTLLAITNMKLNIGQVKDKLCLLASAY